MTGLAIAGHAFALARWRMHRLRSREAVARYQARKLAVLGHHLKRAIPYFAAIDPERPQSWPPTDKSTLLTNFAAMNQAGIPLERVQAALARGDTHVGGHVVGHSTGTSGNRGYFVISDAERYVWLGTLLAKALPDALWRRHRVALALPGFSRLYGSAQGGSRVQLGLFDLAEGIDSWTDRFTAFAADTVVAPPKVLRLLAERGLLTAATVFSAAEVLDPVDAEVIADATGRPVRQIYMATEGLFGVSCAHGTLHLAEDVVAFEWEKAADGSDLVQPIVTDFTRRAQAMARYRMNDLLRLSDARCPCGSALQAVAGIEGRRDDLFWLPSREGALRAVTPDVLRNALLDADRAITDFRIVQTGPRTIRIALPEHGGDAAAVERSIASALERIGVAPAEISFMRGIATPFDTKLRRVRREWLPDQSSISAS